MNDTLVSAEPLTMPRPPKPDDRPRKFRACKLAEDIVLKAAIITQVEGGSVAELLSALIDRLALGRRYSAALKKLQEREGK